MNEFEKELDRRLRADYLTRWAAAWVRCSAEKPCPKRNEVHLILWGECYWREDGQVLTTWMAYDGTPMLSPLHAAEPED